MDADQLDRLLASVPGLRWLDLTGGEILMRADLPSIARSVHARLPALALLHFPSNGLRTSALLEATRLFVRRGGPKVIVTVSVDGPPDVHDRLRGCEGAFAAAVESIRQLRALPGAEVYAGLTLQPGNLDLVDATVAALDRALGGYRHADLHVNVQHRSTHYFANSAIPPVDADRARAALDSLRERKGPPHDPVTAIEWTFLRLAGAHSRSGRSPVPCRSGDLSAYVAPEGTVYACTIDPRPIAHLENFGWDLDRLWQSRQRASLRAEIREDRCVGCWTPCEAYQTLLGSPGKTLKGLLGSLRA